MTDEVERICAKLREHLRIEPVPHTLYDWQIEPESIEEAAHALIERLTTIDEGMRKALEDLLKCCGPRRPDGHHEFCLVPSRDVEAAKDALEALKSGDQ